ncbi:DUF4391 domain-containing protein [bacterium]|nr:DUF4391 domain-containing protein [bacterium]
MNSQLSIMNYLNIPSRCLINQKITKKVLLENTELKASSKKLISNDIQEMLIVASITPETANINTFIDATYCFDEILFLQVTLRKKDSYSKVAELLQSIIPYSILIIFQYQIEVCFNIAEKRINQVDREKRVIENNTFTEWLKVDDEKLNKFIDSIAFPNLSHNNLKTFYDDVVSRLYNLNTSKITGTFEVKSKDDTKEDIVILRKIKEINAEILKLKNNYKKEINFNAKVKLNVKIKKLEKIIMELKKMLLI